MKPKIAICFFGMLGRYNKEKNSIPKDCIYALESLFENVLKDVDYDIFAHTWSNQRVKETFDFIKPTLHSLTPPLEFSKVDQLDLYKSAFKRGLKLFYSYVVSTKFNYKKQQKILNNIMSRYYSSATSVLLMKQFAEKNRIKYTHVLVTRYDLEFFSKFNFSELSEDKIYFGNACEVRSGNNKNIPNHLYWDQLLKNNNLTTQKKNYIGERKGLEDFYFICNYQNAIIMSKIFLKMNTYIKSGIKPSCHHLLEHHTYENFVKEKIDFYKTRLIDFDLSRRYRLNDTN